nr:unnamed protein product [Callosobruchus analis]
MMSHMSQDCGPPLTCPNCNKKYKTKNSLKVHRSRDCTAKSIYICKICNKVLKRKEYTKAHIYTNHLCNIKIDEDWMDNFDTVSDPNVLLCYKLKSSNLESDVEGAGVLTWEA